VARVGACGALPLTLANDVEVIERARVGSAGGFSRTLPGAKTRQHTLLIPLSSALPFVPLLLHVCLCSLRGRTACGTIQVNLIFAATHLCSCLVSKGHELVKCGLVLSLLGGVRKHGGSDERIPVRGDIHVLIVGDPGLGKSQVRFCRHRFPPTGDLGLQGEMT
jgi:hypothetical protein